TSPPAGYADDPQTNLATFLADCRDRLKAHAAERSHAIADVVRPADPRPRLTPVPGKKLSELLVAPEEQALQRLRGGEIGVDELDARLALLCLSCFRRTRSLVALRSVLAPLVPGREGRPWEGPDAGVDRALDVFERGWYLLAAEGGYYWMQRDLRDTL